MNTLLLIEDDHRLANMVSEYLQQSGFTVQHAANGLDGLKVLQSTAPALVLLDLMLPDIDGLDVCKRIRALPGALAQTPVLMLTAKGDPMDRIIGLEMGADDYLSKPFNPRELAARIKAILRRRSIEEHPGAPSHENESISFGPFVLNLANRTLTRDDEVITITTGEFSVLKAFGRHPRIPLSRDKLMELARGREYEVFDRSVDVHISALRRKLGDGDQPDTLTHPTESKH